jgi:hypothetical protein
MFTSFCPIVSIIACQCADGQPHDVLVGQRNDFVYSGFQIRDGNLLSVDDGGDFVKFVLPDEYDVVMRLGGELLRDIGRSRRNS